jgi:peptidase E
MSSSYFIIKKFFVQYPLCNFVLTFVILFGSRIYYLPQSTLRFSLRYTKEFYDMLSDQNVNYHKINTFVLINLI